MKSVELIADMKRLRRWVNSLHHILQKESQTPVYTTNRKNLGINENSFSPTDLFHPYICKDGRIGGWKICHPYEIRVERK